MRVVPGRIDSAVTEEIAEPEQTPERPYLVESLLVGLCGTDRELLHRDAPADQPITIGHESLARVLSGPPDGVHRPGDLVVGVIREACGISCRGCRIGRFDLCETRPLRERGIYAEDGFGSDRWVSAGEALVAVPPGLHEHAVLVEPLTSVVKARRRLVDAMSSIPSSSMSRLLVAGAGTIGLLASWHVGQLFDSVVVVDPNPERAAEAAVGVLDGIELVRSWGDVTGRRFDAFVECSGSVDALIAGLSLVSHAGVAVILGICGAADRSFPSASLQSAVLHDLTLLATVNASRADHDVAASQLVTAPTAFLDAILTNEIEPDEWPAWARSDRRLGIKTVVRFGT